MIPIVALIPVAIAALLAGILIGRAELLRSRRIDGEDVTVDAYARTKKVLIRFARLGFTLSIDADDAERLGRMLGRAAEFLAKRGAA